MSALIPYVTDPFPRASQLSPLKHTLIQMAYIYQSGNGFSSVWYVSARPLKKEK